MTNDGDIITTTKTDHTVDDDDGEDNNGIDSHNISDDESNSDENDDDDDDSSSSSSSSTSIMIQSLPIVIVNLERLCGYAVPEAERDEITQQVRQALLGNNNDNDVNDFEIRVTELFEMKVAHHGDDSDTNSTTFDNDDKYCVVKYPELLYPTDGRVVSTRRLWNNLHAKKKQQILPIKVVLLDRIVYYLIRYNRSLAW